MRIQILEIIYLLGGAVLILGTGLVAICRKDKKIRQICIVLILLGGLGSFLSLGALIKIEERINRNLEMWMNDHITRSELIRKIGTPTEVIEETVGDGPEYESWKYTIHFFPFYTYHKEIHFYDGRVWGYSAKNN